MLLHSCRYRILLLLFLFVVVVVLLVLFLLFLLLVLLFLLFLLFCFFPLFLNPPRFCFLLFRFDLRIGTTIRDQG